MSTLAYGLNYLSTSWSDLGRPTLTLILSTAMTEEGRIPNPMVTTLKKLSSGYINGTRVALGDEAMPNFSLLDEGTYLIYDRLLPPLSHTLNHIKCCQACSMGSHRHAFLI